MNEVICLKCGTVFMGGGGKHCGDDAVPFDLATHGRRLIPAANSWHQVWERWKDHPTVREVAAEGAENGNSSAAGIINAAFERIADRKS